MGFFSKFFNKREVTPPMPELYIEPFGISAGTFVSAEKALTYSAVYRAIALISQTIGFLPWSVYRDMEKAVSHPVHALLHSRPCSEMSAMTFKETMLKDALLWGNAYAEIEFDYSGNVKALWRLSPSHMQVLRDRDTEELFYRYTGGSGVLYDLSPKSIFHLKGFGDGLVGDSVISYAIKTIGAGISSEEVISKLSENNLRPSGVLTYPGRLTDQAKENIREGYKKHFIGNKNVGKLLILEEGMKFEQTSMPPQDAQFLESRKFNIEEIARWFGLPPHKLADLEHATYSNVEHLSQEFVNDCLMPWCKKLEEEADYKLLRNNRAGYYTKIDFRGLLRGDNQSRMEYYKGGVLNGIFSINEARAWEDLPPIDGGDEHFVQAQMIPVDLAAKGIFVDSSLSNKEEGEKKDDSEDKETENVIKNKRKR